MGKKKFGTFILLGAVLGGAASLLDKRTREEIVGASKKAMTTVQYYSNNKDELKLKAEQEKNKYQTLFNKLSEDVTYMKNKFDEVKQLTPQVKELVEDTKDAIAESKEDFQDFTQSTEAPGSASIQSEGTLGK